MAPPIAASTDPAMDPDAIALSRELADRSPSERQAYYVQRDVPLAIRDEVESLLLLTGATSDAPAGDVARATEHVLAGRGHRDAMATSPPEPMSIGRYEVLRLLGRGGMGEVHFARDPVLDRNVAVKLIARDVDDDAARKRLVREARAAGRLQHPNIVTIFDAGEHDGRSYIAMEYVPGETLRSLIRRRAPLPLRRRLELIEGACAGLAHAHRAGVVHLDIKPDNLMLDETGVVKVVDFGIARVLQGDALATRNLSGTLSYMSPEQIAGKSLDRRSDVFSLGCSSFELLAYWPAYGGSTQEIVTRITVGPVPRLLDACPDIDPRLDSIIGRAMAVDPADRYDDLEELRAELSRLRGDIDPVDDERFVARSTMVIPENMPSRVSTPSHRKSATQRPSSAWRSPLAASIVAVAAVTAGAGAFWMWGAKPTPETTPAAAVPVPAARPESARPVGRTEPNATGVSDEVWRRLAAGDRAGVLALLRPVAADKTGTPDVRLPYDVLGAVRTSVLRTRAAVPAPGGRSSASYRSAELRLARADRLEADGRPVEALGALWQAADLYSQATALGQGQPSRPPAERESPIPASPGGSGGVAQQTLPPIVDLPRPEPPSTSAVETPAPTPAASPDQSPPKTPSDADAILDTLRRYQAAYEALDVSAVQRVFPSLDRDQLEQLRRTFTGLTAYSVEIRNPRVGLQAESATVRALVIRRMIPRVGRPVANEVETEFRLRRTGSAWVVTAVTAPGV
jgi:serine/threonine protein kinase